MQSLNELLLLIDERASPEHQAEAYIQVVDVVLARAAALGPSYVFTSRISFYGIKARACRCARV